MIEIKENRHEQYQCKALLRYFFFNVSKLRGLKEFLKKKSFLFFHSTQETTNKSMFVLFESSFFRVAARTNTNFSAYNSWKTTK